MENVASFPMSWLTGVARGLVSLMAWTAVSSFVQVTLVPGLTVTVCGVNWKLTIRTGVSPGAVTCAPWFFLESPPPQAPAPRVTARARTIGPASVVERVMPGVRIGPRSRMNLSCLSRRGGGEPLNRERRGESRRGREGDRHRHRRQGQGGRRGTAGGPGTGGGGRHPATGRRGDPGGRRLIAEWGTPAPG